jgi:hypothetical protein
VKDVTVGREAQNKVALVADAATENEVAVSKS